MKSAIITGASGMLGATLAACLAEKGTAVLAIVRPGSPKRRNLPKHPLIGVLELDIAEIAGLMPQTVAEQLAQQNSGENASLFDPPYDCCYHFAWAGTYGAERENIPLQEANVRYTLDAVALAARMGCRKFIGAGSQAEYGRVAEGVRLSPDTPVNPVSGYGAAKLAAGLLGKLYAGRLGMTFLWARVLSVYGPMDNENALTISTIRKFLRGEHAAFTRGDQLWDFLYSGDAAEAFQLIGEKAENSAVYTLGSGNPVRLADALEMLAHTVSPHPDYAFGELPYRADQCMYLCADLTALQKDTGFTPQISYREGIRLTAAWCAEHPIRPSTRVAYGNRRSK